MQILLTQEEYEALKGKAQAAHDEISATLQQLCTWVANYMPAGVDWIGKEKPWGCILTMKTEWYCDDCPVQNICPQRFKRWSK